MDTVEQIRKALGHCTMEWSPSLWLDTGIPDLNTVIGHRKRGISYGRIIEMSGWESAGKTAITMSLAALAQRGKAVCIWGDFENSFEPDWAIQRGIMPCPECKGVGRVKDHKSCPKCGNNRPCSLCGSGGCKECHNTGKERGTGLDTEHLILLQPYVGTFNGEKKPRLSTGTEMCAEMEKAADIMHRKHDRMILVVDSVASILTEGEAGVGIEGANLRSNMELPMFMGKLLRRWVSLAQSYNAIVILVNQLRENPMARFGDKTYTPGGNAPLFYSHVRIRVRKVGKLTDGGKVVGIQGVLTAYKNKTGGEQWAKVGYRLKYNGPVQFVPAKQVAPEKKSEDE